MKNYEKYADKIRGYKGETFCADFVKPNILGRDSCSGVGCVRCCMLQTIWLLEDYKEPEVDWSKVEVDTPILVKDYGEEEWEKRHFAKYEGGTVYAWQAGGTSWTEDHIASWAYAKPAEMEE